MTRRWDLSYRVHHNPVSRGPAVASITCGNGCGRVHTRPITGKHAPEMVRKHFERLGWDVDLGNARHCICPTCKEKPKAG